MELQLKKVIFQKINSFFQLAEYDGICVRVNTKLDVNYADDQKTCMARYNVDVLPEESDIFSLNLDIVGLFENSDFETDEEKDENELQMYNCLFPYAQMTVADLFTKAGLEPLMIEMHPLKHNDNNID